MTLRPTSSAKHAKDGRTIFSMSRLRSAGSAAQPRGSSRRAKAVNFLTEPSCLSRKSVAVSNASTSCSTSEEGSPWPAKVSVQCTHALQLVFSEHTLCSSLRSEHASEELRCRRWGTHRWRAARQADHACTIAKTRAANIAASSATKKGGARKEWAVAPLSIPTTFSNSRPKMGRKWVKPVGVLNTDLPARWPKIWRLRPSAGRPGGRPLRFVVFHIKGPSAQNTKAACKAAIPASLAGTAFKLSSSSAGRLPLSSAATRAAQPASVTWVRLR